MKLDLILSSPALRARTTAEMVAKKLGYEIGDIVVDECLYAVTADDLLDVIHALSDRPKTVMLFGHNPELTALAYRLSDEIEHMPTSPVAEFRFNVKSWSEIGRFEPLLIAFDSPKSS